MNFRIFESKDDLLRGAARTIVDRVRTGARTIALSGGSTPQPLYTMLGESPWRETLAAVPLTWVIVDERYVPYDHPQSNAGMIQRTLFAQGMSSGHCFLPFRTDLEVEACADDFIAQWHALKIGKLDVVLLGMGDDGHTASLFPGTPVLDVEDRLAAAVYVPKLDMWRLTITKPAIREAGLRLVLAAGAAKKPVLEALRGGNADYPIAHATNGVETWWLIDRDASPGSPSKSEG
jgi:6-phosphogluconolactonase